MTRRSAAVVGLALLFCAVSFVSWAGPPEGVNNEDVLFYASYDKGENADVSKGAPAPVSRGRSTAVEGRVKGARELTDCIVYSAEKNISPQGGTLAFWVCPKWDPQDKKHHALLDWRGASHAYNRLMAYKYAGNNLIYFSARSQKGTKAARKVTAVGDAKGWKPGEWRHVLATWDSEKPELRLYIDGQLAKTVKTRWEFGKMPPKFIVGGKGTIMDELLILNRPLSDTDAKALFSSYPR